jgi:Family of unknown function (DUF6166)
MTRDPDRYYAGTTGAYTVTVTEWGRRKPLPRRLDLFRHSPTGFCWGYGGSSQAQLALAILADVVDVERAVALRHDFKYQRIATIPQDADWSMTASDVLAWVENARHDAS